MGRLGMAMVTWPHGKRDWVHAQEHEGLVFFVRRCVQTTALRLYSAHLVVRLLICTQMANRTQLQDHRFSVRCSCTTQEATVTVTPARPARQRWTRSPVYKNLYSDEDRFCAHRRARVRARAGARGRPPRRCRAGTRQQGPAPSALRCALNARPSNDTYKRCTHRLPSVPALEDSTGARASRVCVCAHGRRV